MVIKCKMCGGDVQVSEEKTLGTCEYCGSAITFPKIDDEKRAAVFNRGNHFRRTGEFDKALAVYEQIIMEDDTDAEAHWCCALCRFGIEYVEDPATLEYVPTCHRVSFDSFLEDVDYLAALEHSEGTTRRQYQKDAMKIAEVQKGILATSHNEEPFDVFICYKESDENGGRTVDSMLAQDIYYQLTDQGYRVFFSRITLEDKVGAEYEPYIFAALNSAKVMLAIGTKPEHYNAVWVKNEWSRFLSLMKKDRSKILLPCYRDMDPYTMPDALSVLQSYDMSKIGFIQDLVRGIKKVVEKKETPVETVVKYKEGVSDINVLLKRGLIALEDRDWDVSANYYEQALNIDPECAEAYWGIGLSKNQCINDDELINSRITESQKVSSELVNVRNFPEEREYGENIVRSYAVKNYNDESYIRSQLSVGEYYYETKENNARKLVEGARSFINNDKYLSKALRYANGEFRFRIERVQNSIIAPLEEFLSVCKNNSESLKIETLNRFHSFCEQVVENIKIGYEASIIQRDEDYNKALECIQYNKYSDAICLLEKVGDYKDSTQLLINVRRDMEAKELFDRKQREVQRKDIIKKTIGIVAIIVIIAISIGSFLLYKYYLKPEGIYQEASEHYLHKEYEQAYEMFSQILDYRNSEELYNICLYSYASEYFENKNYEDAKILFEKLGDFSNSEELYKDCLYNIAREYELQYDFMTARSIYEQLGDYKASEENIQLCIYNQGLSLYLDGNCEEAQKCIDELSSLTINNEELIANVELLNQFITRAITYDNAIDLQDEGRCLEAAETFYSISDYEDSLIRAEENYLKALAKGEQVETIVLGTWDYDDDGIDEPMEWIVLDREDNNILLLSKYVVDGKAFTNDLPIERGRRSGEQNIYGKVDWENSLIRKWLNGYFLDNYGYSNIVVETELDNSVHEDEPLSNSHGYIVAENGGATTVDKIFILSKYEFYGYLQGSSNAVNLIYNNFNSLGCDCWFRTPGYTYELHVSVHVSKNSSTMSNSGTCAGNIKVPPVKPLGIRPAMWIDVSEYAN